MSEYYEESEESEESDEENDGGGVGSLFFLLIFFGVVFVAIVAVSVFNPGEKAETQSQTELEDLGFSNIQIEPGSAGNEAWVSVGGCRLHLAKGPNDDAEWRLTKESVIADITGKPTADMIRKHPRFQECATQSPPSR